MLDPKWFQTRKYQTTHNSHLSTINPASSTINGKGTPLYSGLSEIYAIIFDEQPIVFNSSENFDKREIIYDGDARTFLSAPSELLIRNFYNLELYEKAQLKLGLGEGSDFDRTPDESRRKFFGEIFLSKPIDKIGKSRNRISVLVGDVGTGKSLYVNTILSSEDCYQAVKSGEIWFLRINMQEFARNSLNIEAFVRKLIERILHIISFYDNSIGIPLVSQKGSESLRKECNVILKLLDNGEISKAENSLIEFVSEINRLSNRRFTLILDNIDYVFYANDQVESIEIRDGKGAILANKANARLSAFISILTKIIEPTNNWSKIRASILLILRPDSHITLDKISRTMAGGDPNLVRSINVYSLEMIGSHVREKIIISRLHYLLIGCRLLLQAEMDKYEEVIGGCPIKLPKSFDNYESCLKEYRKSHSMVIDFLESRKVLIGSIVHKVGKIRKCVESAQRMHDSLKKVVESTSQPDQRSKKVSNSVQASVDLSISGFREAIRVYKPFAWVANDVSHDVLDDLDDDEALAGESPVTTPLRISQNPNLSLMVLFLRRRLRFSEKISKFPNIFLASESNARNNQQFNTRPDFWLIHLIHEILRSYGTIKVEILIRMLCGDQNGNLLGSRQQGFYDPTLVANALSRLQRIDGPRLIRIAREIDYDTESDEMPYRFLFEGVELSTRGKFLYQNRSTKDRLPLAWDFLYLQHALDDPDLPLPPELHNRNAFPLAKDRNSTFNGPEKLLTESMTTLPFEYIDDYNYSYLAKEEYPILHSKVLTHKAIKVSRFLGLMEAAFFAEVECYNEAWSAVPKGVAEKSPTFSALRRMAVDVNRYLKPSRRSSNVAAVQPFSYDIAKSEYNDYLEEYTSFMKAAYRRDI